MKKDEKSPRSSPRPDIAGNLLSGMKLVTDSNSSGHLPALVPSSAVHNNDDASIEEVTKTYQQLYIKGVSLVHYLVDGATFEPYAIRSGSNAADQ